MKTSSSRRSAAFTLIELLVAVAVIGLLAALAYPSYTRYIAKSRRADAKTALLDLAARQERYFSVNNAYATTPAQLGYGSTAFPIDVLSGSQASYRLTASASPATTYAASAVPFGNQSRDGCGTYTINQLGVQGNSGNATASSDCW